MDKRNFADLGKEIEDAVKNVVDSQAYKDIKQGISDTIQTTATGIRDAITEATAVKTKNNPRERQERYQQPNRYRSPKTTQNGPAAKNLPVAHNPAGSVGGILMTIFGSLGIGTFLISGMVFFVLLAVDVMPFSIAFSLFFMCMLFLGGSILLFSGGRTLSNRIKRFRQYIRRCRGKTYCSISELATGVGKPPQFVVKDLRKMIALGMFPEGHFDMQETCFMLTNESYQQYLIARESVKESQQIEKKVESEPQDSPIDAAYAEGQQYIMQMRAANAAISGKEVSEKLDRLEQVVKKIFGYVKEHPQQLPDIRKFMSYYLPTTLKLVKTYQEFDAQPIQGENIRTVKQEIQDTLDTINVAFENLLDRLYEDTAMDISTDISALETMLTQEGLTDNEF